MKIYQIISENSDTNEAPMGGLKKLGNKIASKIPGMRGAANARLDVGNDANDMKSDLSSWMAGSGIGRGKLSLEDFKNFLTQKGLPTKQVDDLFSQMRQNPDGTARIGAMKNSEVDKILQKAVQLGFRDRGASSRKSRFAQRPAAAGQFKTGRQKAAAGPDLNSIVSGLSPEQKAALKGML